MINNLSESFVQDLGSGTGKLIMQGKGGKPGAKEGVLTPSDGSVEVRKLQTEALKIANENELMTSINQTYPGIMIIEGPLGTVKQIEKEVRFSLLMDYVTFLTEAQLEAILTMFPPEKEAILQRDVLEGEYGESLGAETQPTVTLHPVDDVRDETLRGDKELDQVADNTSKEFDPDKEIIIVDEDIELVA